MFSVGCSHPSSSSSVHILRAIIMFYLSLTARLRVCSARFQRIRRRNRCGTVFNNFYCFYVIHMSFIYILSQCEGPSMQPALQTDDIIIAEHISPRLGRFDRGDVVLLRSPHNPKVFILKRIVGTEGSKIRTSSDGDVVPRGHLWLEGDNKNDSTDSRDYGPVSQGLVRGRALFRIWPLNSLQWLTSDEKINHVASDN